MGLVRTLRSSHQQYAGFLIHLGFAAVALGVTGSSLGTHQEDLLLSEGQTAPWAGYDIRLIHIDQRALADKLIGEVELEVSRDGEVLATLRPAQHFHLLQQQWTTEVAIQSTWRGDLYTILHNGRRPRASSTHVGRKPDDALAMAGRLDHGPGCSDSPAAHPAQVGGCGHRAPSEQGLNCERERLRHCRRLEFAGGITTAEAQRAAKLKKGIARDS